MKKFPKTLFLRQFHCLFLILSGTLLLCISGCTTKPTRQYSVKFIVYTTPQPAEQQLYITGNNNLLGNWQPAAIPLGKRSDSIWEKTLSFPAGETIKYKITAGSWRTEGLNADGLKYENLSVKINQDTIIATRVFGFLNNFVNGKLYLSADRYLPPKPPSDLDGDWLYQSGDDTNRAKEEYDDSKWIRTSQIINWTKNTDPKWDGNGWFRFHIVIDSTLWNKTLALYISQLGASQVYYNGRLLYSYGEPGRTKETTHTFQNRIWKEFRFDPKPDHVFAIRYANFDWKRQLSLGFAPGFKIYLNALNNTLETVFDETRTNIARQMIFTAFPIILAVLHFFLFVFYRKLKQNLYFSICLIGFAGINYFNIQKNVETNTDIILFYYQLANFFVTIGIFFALLTSYSLSYLKLPKRWLVFLILAILLTIGRILQPVDFWMGIFSYVFIILVILDIVLSKRHRTRPAQEGVWIINLGFGLLGLFVIWQILIDYGFIPQYYDISQIWVFGMLALSLAMSVFLSYNFSSINRSLEAQLVKVQELSEHALEHDRIANKREFERRIIEIESDRKSQELESARQLQLSLLPKAIPQTEKLDIACFMTTATEVGGDYYDFFSDENNDLTVVTGDATGHGLKAGNMVIVTKGILNTLLGTENIDEVMIKANEAIKKMNLPMLTMGLSLLRFRESKASLSSAGMPPLLIYRKQTNTVEQVIIKAMPLGAFHNFPYSRKEISFNNGDIFLLMSDGLPEAFNENKELFGMERVSKLLNASTDKNAKTIINDINLAVKQWCGSLPLQDDLMMIVVKVK